MLAALRFHAKLIFTKANPYMIKEQFRLLTPANRESVLKFDKSFAVNSDTFISRFMLPDSVKCLGHQIGQYVELTINGVTRGYVPISRIDDAGFVDFVIKQIPSTEGATKSASQALINLKPGTQVPVKGPFGKWIYEGHGKFKFGEAIKKYRYVGMIAEGTSMASYFSLLEAISTNHDRTSLSLLWKCPSPGDFFLLPELNWFVQKKTLCLNLIVDKANDTWLGPSGSITSKHIQNYMPKPSDKTLMLIVGSRTFTEPIKQLCKELGYPNINQ